MKDQRSRLTPLLHCVSDGSVGAIVASAWRYTPPAR
jgi:hypothetical protein